MNENERFKHLIKIIGLKQNEIARMMEMSPSSISEVLTGRNGVSSKLVRSLQRVFGVNPEWLIHGTGDRFLKGDGYAVPEVQAAPTTAGHLPGTMRLTTR